VWQNAEVYHVATGDVYIYHWALNGWLNEKCKQFIS